MIDKDRALSVSVILLSLNQVEFLEESLLSVLNQSYPHVECIVIDGGSTDGSVDIIRKYSKRLAYWVSEPDVGIADAYNKAVPYCTGEIMTVHASDDKYFPWAFDIVAEIFSLFPEIQWVTSVSHLGYDRRGRAVMCYHADPGYSREAFFRGRNGGIPGFHTQWVQTSATFWRRSLWDEAGVSKMIQGKRAVDFAIWAAFMKCAEPYATMALLGGERFHPSQGIQNPELMSRYRSEVRQWLEQTGNIPGPIEIQLRRVLRRIPKIARLIGWPCNVVRYDLYKQCWKTQRVYFA
jgi:glycosyltransferase involved in cell wall biosynthesis